MTTSIGILGVGSFLPETIRTNDWWPAQVVSEWVARDQRERAPIPDLDESAQAVLALAAQHADDPFRGAITRHVMDPTMTASDMEIAAGRAALERAGVAAADIDLVLVQSLVQDHIGTNTAVNVQQALGIPSRCFSLLVESACNGFNMQLSMAEAMIRAGRARCALLVQSCSLSRIMDYSQPYSTAFGDGATAVVLGPVSPGRGLLAARHVSDGELGNTLSAGVPGGLWFEAGRSTVVIEPRATFAMMTRLGRYARDTILPALATAELAPSDVDFYASHQGFRWYRQLTQEFAGLSRARALDSFPQTASLSAANIPLILALAEREGLLHDDDIVVTQAGGSGLTYSSLVLRWGR